MFKLIVCLVLLIVIAGCRMATAPTEMTLDKGQAKGNPIVIIKDEPRNIRPPKKTDPTPVVVIRDEPRVPIHYEPPEYK